MFADSCQGQIWSISQCTPKAVHLPIWWQETRLNLTTPTLAIAWTHLVNRKVCQFQLFHHHRDPELEKTSIAVILAMEGIQQLTLTWFLNCPWVFALYVEIVLQVSQPCIFSTNLASSMDVLEQLYIELWKSWSSSLNFVQRKCNPDKFAMPSIHSRVNRYCIAY